VTDGAVQGLALLGRAATPQPAASRSRPYGAADEPRRAATRPGHTPRAPPTRPCTGPCLGVARSPAETVPDSRSVVGGADKTRSPRRHRSARQRVLAVALAADQQHPGVPVDVVQPDRGDLAGRNPSRDNRSKIAKSRRPTSRRRSQDASKWRTATGSRPRAAGCGRAGRPPPAPTAARSIPPDADSAATTAARRPDPAPLTRSVSGTREPETSSHPLPPAARDPASSPRPVRTRTTAPQGRRRQTPCGVTGHARSEGSSGSPRAVPAPGHAEPAARSATSLPAPSGTAPAASCSAALPRSLAQQPAVTRRTARTARR
jgi:hypothetical protein